MRPSLIRADKANKAPRDAVSVSDSFLRFAALQRDSDRPNVVIGEFGLGKLLASLLSSFCNHVRRVVSRSSQEQVARIAAWRVVAAMQDVKPLRHGAVGLLPHNPMGEPGFAPNIVAKLNHAIALRRSSACPRPAFGVHSTLYFREQSFLQRNSNQPHRCIKRGSSVFSTVVSNAKTLGLSRLFAPFNSTFLHGGLS